MLDIQHTGHARIQKVVSEGGSKVDNFLFFGFFFVFLVDELIEDPNTAIKWRFAGTPMMVLH